MSKGGKRRMRSEQKCPLHGHFRWRLCYNKKFHDKFPISTMEFFSIFTNQIQNSCQYILTWWNCQKSPNKPQQLKARLSLLNLFKGCFCAEDTYLSGRKFLKNLICTEYAHWDILMICEDQSLNLSYFDRQVRAMQYYIWKVLKALIGPLSLLKWKTSTKFMFTLIFLFQFTYLSPKLQDIFPISYKLLLISLFSQRECGVVRC